MNLLTHLQAFTIAVSQDEEDQSDDDEEASSSGEIDNGVRPTMQQPILAEEINKAIKICREEAEVR